MNFKVMVTGATGFIGNHLVQELSKDNEVVSVSHSLAESKDSFSVDITKKDRLSKLPSDFDVVFHLAAYKSSINDAETIKRCLDINNKGTINVLEFCRKNDINRLVYSSTMEVYGEPEYLPIDEKHVTAPLNAYSATKLLGELQCRLYSEDYGIKTTILRYSSVYGKGQKPTSLLPIFMYDASKNKTIRIFGKGTGTWDFIYVDDVVSANISAVVSDKTGVFNISSGTETSVKQLAEIVSEVFSDKEEIKIKYDLDKESIERRMFLDNTKAKNKLNFILKYNLKEGLTEMIK